MAEVKVVHHVASQNSIIQLIGLRMSVNHCRVECALSAIKYHP